MIVFFFLFLQIFLLKILYHINCILRRWFIWVACCLQYLLQFLNFKDLFIIHRNLISYLRGKDALTGQATLSNCFCLPSVKGFALKGAGLSGSVECSFDRWSGGCEFNPHWVGNILLWRLIMKYFLQSFLPFCWFKKCSCQFLAKECAQYWLTA